MSKTRTKSGGNESLSDAIASALLLASEEGRLAKEMQFKDVQVSHSVETKQIILPQGMTARSAMKWLEQYADQQEQDVELYITIDAFPLDGALAMFKVLKETYGWTNLIPTKSFFGDILPVLVDVPVSATEVQQVHWGKIQIPGITGYLETGVMRDGDRLMFRLEGVVQRQHEPAVQELAEKIRKKLQQESIYRSKAIRVDFRDKDGERRKWKHSDCPEFIDTDKINPDELIFSETTASAIGGGLFELIENTHRVREFGVPCKRGVLLYGPYGTGKTQAAYVTAKKAAENGWTFIYVGDVRDLAIGLELAKQYQPAVVFAEDLDRAVGQDRNSDVDRIMNTLDGVSSKSSQIITVLTSNQAHEICQGMVRPGRIDLAVEVLPPDSNAAARLCQLYGRGTVAGTLEEIGEAMALPVARQANAAVYGEIVERAKMAAVRRMRLAGSNTGPISITPEDLRLTAESMKSHLDLLYGEQERAKTHGDMVADGVRGVVDQVVSEALKPVTAQVKEIRERV